MSNNLIAIFLLFLCVTHVNADNTVVINSTIYDDSKNRNTLLYEIKDFVTIDDTSIFSLNTELITDDSSNKLVNIKELKWQLEQENYGINIGFDTIFWGVAETYNPVDIINRENLFTAYENKDKLGELIVSSNHFFNNSTISTYFLPKFYKQKFLDKDSTNGVDIDQHIIEQDDHSYALRYSRIIDNIDLGISYFNGTSRKHRLIPKAGSFDAYYPYLKQTSFDLQLTTESTLYKIEYAHKNYNDDSSYSLVSGFERLFVSDIEISLLLEYLKSDDGQAIYQNDIMLGTRFDFANEYGTEGILSILYDNDHGSKILNFDGSSRINDDLKIQATLSLYDAKDGDSLIKNLDNNFNVSLFYYF